MLIPDEGISIQVFRGRLQLKSLEALEVARVSVAMDTAVGSSSKKHPEFDVDFVPDV